jgi:hypothetical protein
VHQRDEARHALQHLPKTGAARAGPPKPRQGKPRQRRLDGSGHAPGGIYAGLSYERPGDEDSDGGEEPARENVRRVSHAQGNGTAADARQHESAGPPDRDPRGAPNRACGEERE